MTATHLDSRTWVAWGLAAMLPALLGRNPWLLVEVLLVVLVVRTVWTPAASAQGMGWFLRLAGVLLLVSVVFNVLTVHAGNRVMITLPDRLPVIGGPLTLNALVFGMVSALALFVLVLTGITVAGLIRWVDLFHALPQRMASIAVTGSVAWAFLPQTAVAWRQIREAQVMRGHRVRGVRDFVPIIVPLLAGGLERSLALAEALEARGFGGSRVEHANAPHRTGAALSLAGGLVALATAGYCLAVGMAGWGAASATLGIGLLAAASRLDPVAGPSRTRYRLATFSRADAIVLAAAMVAALAVAGWGWWRPESLAYRVYPEIAVPPVEPALMLLVTFLLAPALVAGSANA